MTGHCPSCGAEQVDGLLCDRVFVEGRDVSCTQQLRKDLLAVPDLARELEVTIGRRARIGGGKAGKGSAHERWAVAPNAVSVRDRLRYVLTVWAREVWTDSPIPAHVHVRLAPWSSASVIGTHMAEVRRHPDARRLVDTIHHAVQQARWTIDRPADRQYLGTCLYEEDGATCHAEIFARIDADEVTCTQCEVTHNVAERRAWLLKKAEDMIVTPSDAAIYIRDVGHIRVGVQRIRNYVDRGRIAKRPSIDGAMRFRLGDLLTVILDESERKSA